MKESSVSEGNCARSSETSVAPWLHLKRSLDWLDVIRTDPVGAYESLDDFGKASLWKLLLEDDDGHVRPIKVRRVGSNRRYPKYDVVV